VEQIKVQLTIYTWSFILGLIIFIIPSPSFPQTNNTYLKLISPNGGEMWEANSDQIIKWQSSNISRVKIEYSFSGGLAWHTIVSSADASVGHYSWNVPNVQISEVLVKISDFSNSEIFDISSNQFKIFIKSKSLKQTAVAKNGTAVKIMPLGDSITEGEGDDPEQVGYRSRLFDLLDSAGYNFDFVGTQHSGISYSGNPDFDADHEGHGGYETMPPSHFDGWNLGDNIWRHVSINSAGADTAGHWLYYNHPDIILLHIGTNDLDHNGENCDNSVWGEKPSVTIAQYIHNLLDTVKFFDPDITTFLAQIIYNSHSLEPASNLNKAIKIMYDNNISSPQRERIHLVNMYDTVSYPEDFSFSTGHCDYADLHPIESGYNKMAGKWFLALQSCLPFLRLKVFLQGPYLGNGVMTTSLRNSFNDSANQDPLPKTSPYSDSKSVFYSIPDSITDWIFLEIRDTSMNIIKSKSCFLSDHGYVLDPDGLSKNISLGIPPGYYYIVLRHRNHLSIMSSMPQELDGLTTYDFTSDSARAYGLKATVGLGDGKYGMIAGDNDNDEVISISDYNSISEDLSKFGYYVPDDNMDGIVTKSDYGFVSSNLFKYSQVPGIKSR
jgi:GDSL-like Lipase/Acylhydrolase